MYRMLSLPHFGLAGSLALLVILAPVSGVDLSATQDETVPQIEDWQRAELQALVDVVGEALRGELVQLEDPFTLTSDFLKGIDGQTYVPLTVTLEPEALGESSLAMYLYVIPHLDAGAAEFEPADGGEVGAGQISGLPTAVFEDAFFIDVSAAKAEAGAIVLSRAFTAVGGLYDVYVAIRDSMGEVGSDEDEDEAAEAPTAATPRVLMVRSEIEVPDYWNGQLQASSVILAEVVEPLDRPLTPEEQSANPYTLGTTRIVPKQDADYTQTDELSLIMLVYNSMLTSNQMPDLKVDYDFHKQSDAEEEFFNKTSPQFFNDETLPPGFDLAAGHQIVAGQSVPLAGFPIGAFRLQITVTDNVAGTSMVRDVNFNVSQ